MWFVLYMRVKLCYVISYLLKNNGEDIHLSRITLYIFMDEYKTSYPNDGLE